jgi:hypothetical protein
MKLYFVILNSYFDINDFSDNPIKKYLKPYYVTSSSNQAHYYYLALSLNTASVNNNFFYSSP